ncbi:hypothetical protein [Thaumasiovibrio subtropicus]|nr:hypothetical protein [Thaumasiovibrio subtropicus]
MMKIASPYSDLLCAFIRKAHPIAALKKRLRVFGLNLEDRVH